MHQGIHPVHLLMGSGPTSEGYPGAISYLETPPEVRKAIDSLNGSQHGPFFSLIPFLSVLGVLMGAALGAAIAWSVVAPVRKMGEAMREIGSGDLSQTIQVDNRDELGDLASMINETTGKLAKLQEATLANERAGALRERIAQVTLAQEEEKRRVSRELHDGLGPSLAAIGNRIRACQYVVRADPQHAERQLAEIAASLKVHVQEVRALIYDLRPSALDQLGLAGATRQALDRFSQDTGLHTDLDVPEDLRLNPVVEVTAFRVLQECLSNVEKHANARRVEVGLHQTNEALMVRVQDDGRGFDPNSTAPSGLDGGVGLVSMRERAELLGGSLEVRSSPGNGCQIVASIPTMEVTVGTYPHTAS
jgi:signal transduction histidine kinase